MAISETWLLTRCRDRQASIVRLAELVIVLDGAGVAYLPSRDALLVSDLHFEKGSYFRQLGNPLPQYDTSATLHRLEALIDDYQPEEVICLGDSFHDTRSISRMLEPDIRHLNRLVHKVRRWIWVEGNHDHSMTTALPGETMPFLDEGEVRLQHEPEQQCSAQIIGHYHPKTVIRRHRQRAGGRCFVLTSSLLMMPSFGQFTGGLSIDDPVITALAPKSKRQVYMTFEEKLYQQAKP